MPPNLSIIIVSWNVWDLLRGCLESIEKCSRAQGAPHDLRTFGPPTLTTQAPTLEVIVVDNASSDATADLLPARFPWVRFIRSATNLGFTAGNNVGYAASRGETIYFLNPDTEFVANPRQTASATGSDSLWTLYRALIDEPTVALVGPQLRFGDNTPQESRYRFPTPLTPFFEEQGIGRIWQDNPWLHYFHMREWPPTFRHDVDCVVGAAMLARRSALEEIRQPNVDGPFDESFFMYSEEIDLCHRLKHAGWRIVFVPEAVVIHYEGRSSGQVIDTRNIYFFQSKIRYCEKYFGPLWAECFRLFMLGIFRSKLIIESGKWLLGHRRALRAKRVAAYRKILASKLLPYQKAPTTSTR